MEVRHIQSDFDVEWADGIYAPANRPPAIKDWPVVNSVLINPRMLEKVFAQTFDFGDIKAASPYAEERRALLPFVLMPGDIISVDVLSSAPITEEARAYFILCQYPHWQETLVFHRHVNTDRNSAHMFSIVKFKIEKPILTWRNWTWGDATLPATRIILTVLRYRTDQAPIEVSPNRHPYEELDTHHDRNTTRSLSATEDGEVAYEQTCLGYFGIMLSREGRNCCEKNKERFH